MAYGLIAVIFCNANIILQAASNSIARVWDERAIAAIRVDTPHPPAQARNLFSLSVCLYDAWAAYDSNAVGYVYQEKHSATNIAAARAEAISYAAYRLLKERHAYSRTAATTLAADDTQMAALGYDTNNVSRDTSTPAGVGNSVYDAVSAWFINDGSRQTNGIPYPIAPLPIAYPDYPPGQGGYVYINPPLATDRPGITTNNFYEINVIDINHWQRLQIANNTDQNGFATGPIQNYLGPQWLGVRAFALERTDPTKPWIDPGPPPFFGGPTHTQFVNEVVAVITADSQLTPDDGATIDISPGAWGNNSLDFAGHYGDGSFEIFDGHGYPTNPVTGLPYASNVVKRGDFARVLAEFWADGPNSETPPGHWNVLANYVADNPLTVKKIGGVGPIVDNLEWDVKMYFAVNAALHDAACACWAAKRYYDGWRPISAVRYLAALGQSSDPGQASYNSKGLPLIPNLIELVTSNSIASGRHAGLTAGKIAVLAWPGPPTNFVTQHSGVKWIHADAWRPYQRTNFVTPAFPGYFSGHSTFSRAAAEVLTSLTGSAYFPGGMGVYSNYSLGFENGPSQPVTLQWATYYEAADQAGISRIWGGIHPPVDNFQGRRAGALCGQGVWALVQKYFNANKPPVPVAKVSPLLVFEPNDTNQFILAPNDVSASVVLDASQTSDPDNNTLQCSWYADGQTNPCATGPVATQSFAIGPHTVKLVVNDGHDTAMTQVGFEVITPADAVGQLMLWVDEANLAHRNKQPLLATLSASYSSFERGNPTAGYNQLSAFQNQVRAQVTRVDPGLADALIAAAQQISMPSATRRASRARESFR